MQSGPQSPTAPARMRAEDHLRLVRKVARRYRGRGLDFEDLCQVGTIGLMRAVALANAGRPWKPVSWINSAIVTAVIDQGSEVRTPAWAYRVVGRWLRLERLDGRAYPIAEVATKFGLTPARAEMVESARRARAEMGRVVASEGAAWARRQVRGERGAPGDVDEEVVPLVRDDPPWADAEVAAEVAWLRAALGCLDGRSCAVLRLRYGLDDGVELTRPEIGARFGLSGEWARKVETRALARLRELAGVA